MQRQILINVMIFFAYTLNLPLNTQRPHHRSQRAGKLGLDFGSWQSPDILRSHLYRGTFPWTPPTAIYRAYTVCNSNPCSDLTHWGRVTHICVGNLTIIGSDNGLSPGRRQAIIWTNAGISLIGPLGTNFSEISTEIITFSFKKMYLKVSSAKWRPFSLGLNVLSNSLSKLLLKLGYGLVIIPHKTPCL